MFLQALRGGRARKESKLRGSETQVSAELKQSFLALLLSCPWLGLGREGARIF